MDTIKVKAYIRKNVIEGVNLYFAYPTEVKAKLFSANYNVLSIYVCCPFVGGEIELYDKESFNMLFKEFRSLYMTNPDASFKAVKYELEGIKPVETLEDLQVQMQELLNKIKIAIDRNKIL